MIDLQRTEVEARAQAARNQLLRYDGHQMVVNLYAYARMRLRENPLSYEFPYVEYAALIYWVEPPAASPEPLTEEAVETAYRDIGRLMLEVTSLYRQEANSAAANRDLEELALRAKHFGLMIRNHAYEQHHREIWQGLFEPFAAEIRSQLSFSVSDVVACFEVLGKVEDDSRAAFRAAVKAASTEGTEGTAALSQTFGDYYAFAPNDVARHAAIDSAMVGGILAAFSVKYGDAGEHTLLPSPFSVLRERPFLDLGDGRYLIPNPSNVVPSIKPRIEALLNPAVTPTASAGLWTRYERHRGRWVEETSYQLLEKMIPNGRGAVGGYYLNPADGLQVESDVVYEVDDLVVLIEAKAGAFTPATFRGAPGSLKTDLTNVLRKGHEQTIRSQDYILAGNRSFTDSGGDEVFSLTALPREILRMVVTLTPSDVFATSPMNLQRAGLIQDKLTWITCERT